MLDMCMLMLGAEVAKVLPMGFGLTKCLRIYLCGVLVVSAACLLLR